MNKKQLIALILALAMCACVFTGCSSSEKENSKSTEGQQTEATANTTEAEATEETEPEVVTYTKVVRVADIQGNTITAQVYSGAQVENYKTLDMTGYTATDETMDIEVGDTPLYGLQNFTYFEDWVDASINNVSIGSILIIEYNEATDEMTAIMITHEIVEDSQTAEP